MHTTSFSLKGFLAAILCGFLTVVTVGCGDSGNDNGGFQGGPYPVATGGFLVQLSEPDLSLLFPDPDELPVYEINPAITQITTLVYTTQGVLVSSATSPFVPNGLYNQTIDGLSIAPYNVVVVGRDIDGDVVGAAQATGVFSLAGGFQLLDLGNFFPLDAFALPDGV